MKLGYTCGTFDVLRANDLKELDKKIQLSKQNGNTHFALGIYEEELVRILSGSTPLKSIEDRMKIAEQIRNVDFVFSIPSLDKNIVKKYAKEAFNQYTKTLDEKKTFDEKKKYKIAYAPGTYDLFHAGHLENLLIAASQCEYLIAGVKSDDLVRKNKNRNPVLSEEERGEILRHFKFIKDTYIYYTSKHLPIASEWIEEKYEEKPDAFFMGSDLAEAVSGYKDLNIVFTDRSPEIMKVRSTTYYRTIYLNNCKSEGKYVSNDLQKKLNKERKVTVCKQKIVGLRNKFSKNGQLKEDRTNLFKNESTNIAER